MLTARRSGLVRGAEERGLLLLELVLGENPGLAKLSEAFKLPDQDVHRRQIWLVRGRRDTGRAITVHRMIDRLRRLRG
jgi:hypothetical protein